MTTPDEASRQLWENLEHAPFINEPIQTMFWDGTGRLALRDTRYQVLRRLYPETEDPMNDEAVLTYRYLVQDESTGERLCLTTTPVDLRATYRGPRERSIVESDIRQFCREPANLLLLAEAEQQTGTHYFPRLRSPLIELDDGHLAYLMEFVPGGSLADIPVDEWEQYRDQFQHAIAIGHRAGVGFFDLSIEDLRVLPDGRVMIIDHNTDKPLDGRPYTPGDDFAQLDALFEIPDDSYDDGDFIPEEALQPSIRTARQY